MEESVTATGGAVLDDLQARGLIAHSTDLDALRAQMDEGPITYYVGFDPTAPSLHVGNLLQILTARRLQLAGHRPLLLVGGSTGLIGDPKEAGERVMNTKETVGDWVERIRGQVSRFVDLDGPSAATLVNNLDWTQGLSTIDFLRDIGKHFPVNRMLARDVVSSRLESGISYTEFSYVLLQSLDYLELHRRHGCVLQTGGSDQWGNITAGVELVRRSEGAKVHALATPLITKADGTKFGKTESGTVWLDPALMSPYAFYQSWIQAEDAKVGEYLKQFTFVPLDEIDALLVEHVEKPGLRLAQRRLAAEVTALVHGSQEVAAAELASTALFGRGDLAELPESTLAAALREAGAVDLAVADAPTLTDALVAAGLVDSRSAARRAVSEGGAYVNNVRAEDPELLLADAPLLHGSWLVLRKGKRGISGVFLNR
ncbi:tyrosine--tRNA ligase [Aeromicrobium sp. Root495]|nr:tyrosine--tRNA ligase [Aeromicrobium sp. Root495]